VFGDNLRLAADAEGSRRAPKIARELPVLGSFGSEKHAQWTAVKFREGTELVDRGDSVTTLPIPNLFLVFFEARGRIRNRISCGLSRPDQQVGVNGYAYDHGALPVVVP
jgi:hypothetical protein